MKIFFVMALIISNLHAATMYTFDGEFKIESSIPYFYVTDFNNQFQHCYTGETFKACDLVKEGESTTYSNYHEGAHDYFEVLSCYTELDFVKVKVKLYNDYDNEFRQREVSFGKCN